jgi:peptide/nickel transport system substrate-binding protein
MASSMILKTCRRPSALVLACALSAAIALSGCERQTPPIAAETAADTPRRGGTLVLGWSADVAGFNELTVPASNVTDEVLFKMFLHLVEEQGDFGDHPPTFEPQLAESWEWSDDHKTLTFHLREDAVWSDGVPVTAEDVRWTWQAQTHPDVAWDSALTKESISDVEVVDPHTVRYHFTRVYSKMLLDANEGMILPKHAWSRLPFSEWRQKGDWFRENLVVNGPFTLGSRTPQQEVVLVRNERYFEPDRPYLDRVVLRIVPDTNNLMAQLYGGQVDFVPQIPSEEAERVRNHPNLELYPYWYRLYVVIAWNHQDPRFADPDVRRALTLGIDRETIVETLWGEHARVAVSPIVQAVWAHDRTLRPHPYDPGQARALLEAEGWRDTDGDGVLDKDGKPFAFELLTNAGNREREDAAVMIQDQLKRIGVRAEPRVVEFNSLLAAVDSGEFAGAMAGFGMDTSLDLTSMYHSRSIAEGSNWFGYSSPEVDRLIEQASVQAEPAEVRPYLDRAQRQIHQDQPVTFLWESQRLIGMNKRLRNAQPNMLFALFNLEDWWLASER